MAIGILGGGLAGISIAAHLDQDCEVLEKETRGGGHCQTVQEHGFTYDAGGPHIIFSRNQEMVDYMVVAAGRQRPPARRNNKIFYQGPLRKVSLRERPVRSRSARSLRVPLSLHQERLSAAQDQFQGMDLPPLRQGPGRKIPDPLQREDLERSGRGARPGVGGRPRPQAARWRT